MEEDIQENVTGRANPQVSKVKLKEARNSFL